LANKHTFTT